MVVVEVERSSVWTHPENVQRRLQFAPGRWHYHCTPSPVRQYASVLSEAGSLLARLRHIVSILGAERINVFKRTPDGHGYITIASHGEGVLQSVEHTLVRDIVTRLDRDGVVTFSVPDDVDVPGVTPREILMAGRPESGVAVSAPLGHAWTEQDIEVIREAAASLCR
jgi:hypothetical protein